MAKRMTLMKCPAKRPGLKRALIVTALILCSFSPAFASYHYEMRYHNTIRPNGHERSKAVGDAALDACFSQTCLARNAPASPAFKDCMKDHGYQWGLDQAGASPAEQTDGGRRRLHRPR
jgi:hypothetical protein